MNGKPHVLVTGATGFIGKVLCRTLEERGFRVRAALRKQVPELPASDAVVVGEIGERTDWQQALSGIDTVVHLAGRAHVLEESSSNPLEEFRRVNVKGTMTLARAAAAEGVKRLVFVSSIGVHGDSTQGKTPFTEISPFQPYDDYSKSKWEAEESLRQFAAGSQLEVVIVRPALVYGPDAPGNFGLLLQNAGKRLPLGAVKNQRSLISVRNLADFLTLCCTHPDAANESFVICDGEDWSTTELIQIIADAQDVDAKLLPIPAVLLRAGAAMTGKKKMAVRLLDNLQVDISKATHLLGWKPPHASESELATSAKLSSHPQ